MARKRYSDEDIMNLLRQIELDLNTGSDVESACRKAGISAAVAPCTHAVIITDQAGWHLTPKLEMPANITVLPLPPRAPELNPVEDVWQFLRDNYLSNRVFASQDKVLDSCCGAWKRLADNPAGIMSIGKRSGAHQ